jgi:hypothetical protein
MGLHVASIEAERRGESKGVQGKPPVKKRCTGHGLVVPVSPSKAVEFLVLSFDLNCVGNSTSMQLSFAYHVTLSYFAAND